MRFNVKWKTTGLLNNCMCGHFISTHTKPDAIIFIEVCLFFCKISVSMSLSLFAIAFLSSLHFSWFSHFIQFLKFLLKFCFILHSTKLIPTHSYTHTLAHTHKPHAIVLQLALYFPFNFQSITASSSVFFSNLTSVICGFEVEK